MKKKITLKKRKLADLVPDQLSEVPGASDFDTCYDTCPWTCPETCGDTCGTTCSCPTECDTCPDTHCASCCC